MIIVTITLIVLLILASWYTIKTHNQLIRLTKDYANDKVMFTEQLIARDKLAEEQVDAARRDSRKRSRATVEGNVKEVFAPYLSWWAYSSQSDARFIGHPIDFIVFNGLTDGELKEVIFVEVGNENKERELNKHERQVRDIIQQGKVRWECIKINLGEEKNNGKQPQTISTD